MVKVIKFDRAITPENPLTAEELSYAERTLARLVAAAYAADHPELFATKCSDVSIITTSRLQVGPIGTSPGDQGNAMAGDIYARTE